MDLPRVKTAEKAVVKSEAFDAEIEIEKQLNSLSFRKKEVVRAIRQNQDQINSSLTTVRELVGEIRNECLHLAEVAVKQGKGTLAVQFDGIEKLTKDLQRNTEGAMMERGAFNAQAADLFAEACAIKLGIDDIKKTMDKDGIKGGQFKDFEIRATALATNINSILNRYDVISDRKQKLGVINSEAKSLKAADQPARDALATRLGFI